MWRWHLYWHWLKCGTGIGTGICIGISAKRGCGYKSDKSYKSIDSYITSILNHSNYGNHINCCKRSLEPLSAARNCHFVHCFWKVIACSVSFYVSVRGLQVFGEVLESPRL